MTTEITRRNLLLAGVAATAALGLAGCSDKTESTEWDGASYLPMGSVVTLKEDKYSLEHVVIGRRPRANSIYTVGADRTIKASDNAGCFDYVSLYWPEGYSADLGTIEKKLPFKLHFFNAEQIGEVLFHGYEDDMEKEAQAILASAKEAGTDSLDALGDMTNQILSQLEGAS